MKDITWQEFVNLPLELQNLYDKVLMQNMGFCVIISATEYLEMKSKYPKYFLNDENKNEEM